MNTYLRELRDRKVQLEKRASQINSSNDIRLKAGGRTNGKKYYSVKNKDDSKFTYLGNEENEKVNEIKEAKFLRKTLQLIDGNINTLEASLSNLRATDYDSINEMLPALYRNPKLAMSSIDSPSAKKWKDRAEKAKAAAGIFREEELIIKTDDGAYVRSKSEAMIYNDLLSKGVTFVYEMPMSLGTRTVWPDFVLLSEIDYKSEIIIEHQGMMNKDQYRNRFYEKMYYYLCHGFVQGLNIFYTFDTINGGFDKAPIQDIIDTRIRPK